MIAGRHDDKGQKAADELNSKYSKGGAVAAFFHCDVASWESQVALLRFAKECLGRIDYYFANAGMSQMGEMRSADPTHFGWEASDLATLADRPPPLDVIRVNLDGMLYSLHAALAYFRAQDKDADGWRGKFVATGSNASIYAFPNDPLYAATKHGLLGAVRAVGPRALAEGITVNCFGPSVVATGLAPPDFLEKLEREDRLTPMSTVMRGIDVFLDPKSKVTGHFIENCSDRNVIRAVPRYMDDKAVSFGRVPLPWGDNGCWRLTLLVLWSCSGQTWTSFRRWMSVMRRCRWRDRSSRLFRSCR